ncbi:MAG: metal-sensitive transcriptional regulator [Brasilonema octagenarum HA4186-MV1]|jgi:DNA-binding FrmR family transcriptional regulator|nr:metal-sensitive transcriptional regulator [Brasilonema octagenarum HA4186-MV1]
MYVVFILWGGINVVHSQNRQILNRLARIKGHVEGIYEMVEAQRPNPDVILQIVAVRSALNKVALLVLVDYIEHRLIEAAETGDFETELSNFRWVLDLLI